MRLDRVTHFGVTCADKIDGTFNLEIEYIGEYYHRVKKACITELHHGIFCVIKVVLLKKTGQVRVELAKFFRHIKVTCDSSPGFKLTAKWFNSVGVIQSSILLIQTYIRISFTFIIFTNHSKTYFFVIEFTLSFAFRFRI